MTEKQFDSKVERRDGIERTNGISGTQPSRGQTAALSTAPALPESFMMIPLFVVEYPARMVQVLKSHFVITVLH